LSSQNSCIPVTECHGSLTGLLQARDFVRNPLCTPVRQHAVKLMAALHHREGRVSCQVLFDVVFNELLPGGKRGNSGLVRCGSHVSGLHCGRRGLGRLAGREQPGQYEAKQGTAIGK
jgi:hypothetical protein